MKSTGMVRRVDRLGRLVLPKEIRDTLGIKVGDGLEIRLDKDDQIILKKYAKVQGMNVMAILFLSAIINIFSMLNKLRGLYIKVKN